MLVHLTILFLLVAVCVTIHGLGMVVGLRWMGTVWRQRRHHSLSQPRVFWLLICLVFGLLLLHLLQITVWAGFYELSGWFPSFETSFYYSATCYSTVGFGDVIPPIGWRVFGAIEAVTGVLMFGWSTGVLFTVVHRLHLAVFNNSTTDLPKADR